MHASGLQRAALLTRAAIPLPATTTRRFRALLARRRAGEPVAYLTGQREFWSLPLVVSRATLIPRPETELLVEQALKRLPADGVRTVADVGTGCGAIALALACERPRCRVLATDASGPALRIARRNAQALGLERIEFRHGRWLGPLAGETLDLIVSNPPYVRRGDPHLRRGDLRFEPRSALVGGVDGLHAVRQLIAQARRRLRAGGWILLEHAPQQTRTIARALRAHGYAEIRHYHDLAGRERASAARVPPAA